MSGKDIFENKSGFYSGSQLVKGKTKLFFANEEGEHYGIFINRFNEYAEEICLPELVPSETKVYPEIEFKAHKYGRHIEPESIAIRVFENSVTAKVVDKEKVEIILDLKKIIYPCFNIPNEPIGSVIKGNLVRYCKAGEFKPFVCFCCDETTPKTPHPNIRTSTPAKKPFSQFCREVIKKYPIISFDIEQKEDDLKQIGVFDASGPELIFDFNCETNYLFAIDKLIQRCRDKQIVIGHNINFWDRPIIRSLCKDNNALSQPLWDTLWFATYINPFLSCYTLKSLRGGNFKAHNAVDDAQASMELFLAQVTAIGRNELREIISVYSYPSFLLELHDFLKNTFKTGYDFGPESECFTRGMEKSGLANIKERTLHIFPISDLNEIKQQTSGMRFLSGDTKRGVSQGDWSYNPVCPETLKQDEIDVTPATLLWLRKYVDLCRIYNVFPAAGFLPYWFVENYLYGRLQIVAGQCQACRVIKCDFRPSASPLLGVDYRLLQYAECRKTIDEFRPERVFLRDHENDIVNTGVNIWEADYYNTLKRYVKTPRWGLIAETLHGETPIIISKQQAHEISGVALLPEHGEIFIIKRSESIPLPTLQIHSFAGNNTRKWLKSLPIVPDNKSPRQEIPEISYFRFEQSANENGQYHLTRNTQEKHMYFAQLGILAKLIVPIVPDGKRCSIVLVAVAEETNVMAVGEALRLNGFKLPRENYGIQKTIDWLLAIEGKFALVVPFSKLEIWLLRIAENELEVDAIILETLYFADDVCVNACLSEGSREEELPLPESEKDIPDTDDYDISFFEDEEQKQIGLDTETPEIEITDDITTSVQNTMQGFLYGMWQSRNRVSSICRLASGTRLWCLDPWVRKYEKQLGEIYRLTPIKIEPLLKEEFSSIEEKLRQRLPAFARKTKEVSLENWEETYLTLFRHESLRTFQEDGMTKIMNGESLMIMLPTGEGKSDYFRFPAVFLGSQTGRLTVVVCPLKSLMMDQVAFFQNLGIIHCACYISSDMSREEREFAYERITNGETLVLFVAPERFRNSKFVSCLSARIRNDSRLEYWVVDEAHCLSLWGLNFRPDYRFAAEQIQTYYDKLTPQSAQTPVLLLSATITNYVENDIRNLFADRFHGVIDEEVSG